MITDLARKVEHGGNLSTDEVIDLVEDSNQTWQDFHDMYSVSLNLIIRLYELGIHNILGNTEECKNVKEAIDEVNRILALSEVDYGFRR